MKRPVEQPKRGKETNEIIEVLYNFHDLPEIVTYEEFYEGSCVEEFQANCSMSRARKRIFYASNWKSVSDMQHMKK